MDERSGSIQGTPSQGKVPFRRPLVTRSSPYSKPRSTPPPQRSPLASIFTAPINYVYQVASKWTAPLSSAQAGTNDDANQAPNDFPAIQALKRAAENGSQVGVTDGGAAEQQDMQLDRPESSDQLNTSIAERVIEACHKDGLGEDKLQAVSSILQASTPVAASTGRQTAAWVQPTRSTPPAFTTTRLSPLQSMSAQLAAQSVLPPPSRSQLLSRPPSAGRAAAPRFSPSTGSMFQEKPPTPFPSISQMPAFTTGRFSKVDRAVNRTRLGPMRTPTHLRPLGTAVRPQGADSDMTGSAFDGAPSISQPSSPRGTSIPPENGVRARGLGRPTAVSWTPMRNITRAQLPSGPTQRPAGVGTKRGAQDISATGGSSYAGTHTRVVRPRVESRPVSRGGQNSGAAAPFGVVAPSGLITAPNASPTPRPPTAPGAVPLPATETARRLAAALDMLPAAKPAEPGRLSTLAAPSEPAVLPPPPPTDSLGPTASPLRSLAPFPTPTPSALASVAAPAATIPTTSRPSVTFAPSPDLPQAFKSLVPQQTRAPTPYPQPSSQALTAQTPSPPPSSTPQERASSPPRAKQLDFTSPPPTTSTPAPSSPSSPMFLFPKASSPPVTPPPPATGAALFSFNPPSSSGSPPTPSMPAKPSSAPSCAGSAGLLSGRTITTETTPAAAAAAGTKFGNGSLAVAASNGDVNATFGSRGREVGPSAGLLPINGSAATGQSRALGAKSERTYKFGGKRDSKLDEVLRAAAAKYTEDNGVTRTYQFGKKRIRTEGTAQISQPPLPSPTVTAKQQLDAKATLAVAASVPLPSDSDDEGPSPSPPPSKPAAAPAAAKPAPAAGGWDLAFLQKSQASMAAASKAASEEIEKVKGGVSSAPASSFTFGTASPPPPASTSFGGLRGPASGSAPASSAAAAPSMPAASAAPAKPAPATGGWGADLLAKASAGLSKASAAAAEEIDKKKGGATPPAATVTTTATASSQDTGLLSFLGATAASSTAAASFGTVPSASAPASSFSFGTTSSAPPSSSFSFGATTAAAATASSSSFTFGSSAPAGATLGGFPSLSSGAAAAAADASKPPSGFGFGASTAGADKTPDVAASKPGEFGSGGGAFVFGSSTPAFGASAMSGNGPATTSSSGGFSFGVSGSKPNEGGSDTPPAIGFGAPSTPGVISNGPSAGAPSSGFTFGATPTAPSSSPSLPFASTTFPAASFGASAPASQPDTSAPPAPSNGSSFVFGASTGNAFGSTSMNPSGFDASSSAANGFSFGASAPATNTGSSLFGAEPAASGAALFGAAGSGSLFGSGVQAPSSGAGAASTAFTFGSNPTPPSFGAPAPAPTFGTNPAPSFGAPAPTPASGFTFGSNPSAAPPPAASSSFNFGAAPAAAPAFNAFGGAAPAAPAADGAPGFALGTGGEVPAKRRILKARRRG